jgi:hypothetical protein
MASPVKASAVKASPVKASPIEASTDHADRLGIAGVRVFGYPEPSAVCRAAKPWAAARTQRAASIAALPSMP